MNSPQFTAHQLNQLLVIQQGKNFQFSLQFVEPKSNSVGNNKPLSFFEKLLKASQVKTKM